MTDPSDRPAAEGPAAEGPPFSPVPSTGAADHRTVVLTGADLTVADVEAVARHGAGVVLDGAARGRIQEARAVIEALVAAGEVVYGVTTGFGDLASTFVPAANGERLQENLLM
ncbi:MAG: aromatic amino acid lyase, partial [Chloroflexota bacterium]|nr:aromatic amino acid lyase [Chloroflexota bacterium]